MTEAIEVLRRFGEPVDTGALASAMKVDRTELFAALNAAAKDGKLERHGLLVENGTRRPTLCFGWSCPAD